MSSILFIFSQAPHGRINAQEGLDALLMGSAFTQCSALFHGDAVLQLIKDQAPESMGFKNFSLGFSALADYGVSQIACSAASLEAYGLSAEDLAVEVTQLDSAGIQAMITGHDRVLNF